MVGRARRVRVRVVLRVEAQWGREGEDELREVLRQDPSGALGVEFRPSVEEGLGVLQPRGEREGMLEPWSGAHVGSGSVGESIPRAAPMSDRA